MPNTIYIYQFSDPYEGADYDEVPEVESSRCPLCGEGENHKDIQICDECKDVFN